MPKLLKWTFLYVFVCMFHACTQAGDTEPVTEMIVVIQSDLMMPPSSGAEMDTVKIRVISGDDDQTQNVILTDTSSPSFPLVFSVQQAAGMGEQLRVEVTGSLNENVVIEGLGRAQFFEQQTRMLRVILWDECQGIFCSAPNDACGIASGGCEDVVLNSEAWTGSVPQL